MVRDLEGIHRQAAKSAKFSRGRKEVEDQVFESLKCLFLGAAAPKIQAGKTTTLAAGKPAKVKSRVAGGVTFFDLSIPQGVKGNTGAAGPTGAVGPKGEQGEPADKHRSIFIPGNGLAYTAGASGVTQTAHGLSLANTATTAPEFTVLKPADWDLSTTFSVTLYFAVVANTASDTTAKWRIKVESANINLTGGGGGWDSLNFENLEDATALLVSQTVYGFVMKSQTWTSKWSGNFGTYYFGTSVNTNNEFSHDELWRFSFSRGFPVSNGESATNTLVITGASVDYQSK